MARKFISGDKASFPCIFWISSISGIFFAGTNNEWRMGQEAWALFRSGAEAIALNCQI